MAGKNKKDWSLGTIVYFFVKYFFMWSSSMRLFEMVAFVATGAFIGPTSSTFGLYFFFGSISISIFIALIVFLIDKYLDSKTIKKHRAIEDALGPELEKQRQAYTKRTSVFRRIFAYSLDTSFVFAATWNIVEQVTLWKDVLPIISTHLVLTYFFGLVLLLGVFAIANIYLKTNYTKNVFSTRQKNGNLIERTHNQVIGKDIDIDIEKNHYHVTYTPTNSTQLISVTTPDSEPQQKEDKQVYDTKTIIPKTWFFDLKLDEDEKEALKQALKPGYIVQVAIADKDEKAQPKRIVEDSAIPYWARYALTLIFSFAITAIVSSFVLPLLSASWHLFIPLILFLVMALTLSFFTLISKKTIHVKINSLHFSEKTRPLPKPSGHLVVICQIALSLCVGIGVLIALNIFAPSLFGLWSALGIALAAALLVAISWGGAHRYFQGEANKYREKMLAVGKFIGLNWNNKKKIFEKKGDLIKNNRKRFLLNYLMLNKMMRRGTEGREGFYTEYPTMMQRFFTTLCVPIWTLCSTAFPMFFVIDILAHYFLQAPLLFPTVWMHPGIFAIEATAALIIAICYAKIKSADRHHDEWFNTAINLCQHLANPLHADMLAKQSKQEHNKLIEKRVIDDADAFNEALEKDGVFLATNPAA